jgi:amidase
MSDDRGSAHLDRRQVLSLAAGAATAIGTEANGAAAPPSDIVEMDARALAAAIRARRISCAEVMAAYLKQIERLNGGFNAIVSMRDPDELMAEARARDDVYLKRRSAIPPLWGLPHAVKDLAALKGVRFTSGGSPLFKDRIAAADALPVERIRAAGVIFLGKTNAPEYGLGSHTVNPIFGATRNAFVPSKSAGGSSGGAGVGLALRMLPLADGSDYAGSLRNPAGWNNVCGFRTSFGRVPVDALDAWLPSMGVTGPMARSVSDLALLLSVQSGYDPRAPLSMEGDGRAFAGPLTGDLKGKRIGWLGDFGGAAPCEPEVLGVCREALKRFESIGCTVEEAVPAYDVEEAWQAFIRLRSWQQSASFAEFGPDPAKRALFNEQAVFEYETAKRQSAYDLTAASVIRTQWTAAVRHLFDRFDYLIAPTAQLFPFDIGLKWPTEIAGVSMRTYHEWMKGVCLITFAGTPSLAVPAGFSASGAPMGLQIIAPVHHEMDCLRLGAAFEAADPLWKRLPGALTT